MSEKLPHNREVVINRMMVQFHQYIKDEIDDDMIDHDKLDIAFEAILREGIAKLVNLGELKIYG